MADKVKNDRKPNFVTAYVQSAFEEFGKVTWPTREQAMMLTGIVVAVSVVTAAFIGALDYGFTELYKLALDRFSS